MRKSLTRKQDSLVVSGYDGDMRRLSILAWLITLLLLPSVLTPNQKPKGRGSTVLLPGQVVEGRLSLRGDRDRLRYEIEVTDDILQVEFEILSANHDFDLYFSQKPDLDQADAEDFAAVNSDWVEKLTIHRFWGDGKLTSGRWYLYVVAAAPKDSVRRNQEARFQLIFRAVTIQYRNLTVLNPSGALVEGVLDSDSGMCQFYTFDIPPSVSEFRVAVTNNLMDIDFFLRKGQPITTRYESDVLSESYTARESVLVTSSQLGQPVAGRWYLVVTQKPTREHRDAYTLYVGPGADVPASFKVYPTPLQPSTNDPILQAAYAIVELVQEDGGGSGTLVSSSGLILTNRHVITNLAGKSSPEVVVALTLDPGKPAVELFLAEPVWENDKVDLALLQIRRGRFGQPLPPGFRFPFLPIQPTSNPPLGSWVWAIGFPVWGGRGTKTSVTVSRGILAGYEDTNYGRAFKVDAALNQGSSGGAILNERLQLIAISTSLVYDQAGQLGYAHPLTLLPQSWLQQMGR